MTEERKEISRKELSDMISTNDARLGKVKIEATAVVRRADGSVKYDNPDNAGTYCEEGINDS
jgi:hypothetical protein